MGLYINHPSMDKQAWLKTRGFEITKDTFLSFVDNDEDIVVCLAHNAAFTAAAIGYSAKERKYFSDEIDDRRPRNYYIVPCNTLSEVGLSYDKIKDYRDKSQ